MLALRGHQRCQSDVEKEKEIWFSELGLGRYSLLRRFKTRISEGRAAVFQTSELLMGWGSGYSALSFNANPKCRGLQLVRMTRVGHTWSMQKVCKAIFSKIFRQFPPTSKTLQIFFPTSVSMLVKVIFFGLIALVAGCAMTEEQRRQLPPKTVIKNIYLFDGFAFLPYSQVVIVNGLISSAPASGANTTIDGTGMYLLPGLIDTHCHIMDCAYLTQMRQYGVTTALDIGTHSYSSLTT